MTTPDVKSVFTEIDLHAEANNTEHNTVEISKKELLVRRGQPFKLTLKVAKSYNLKVDTFIMTAKTGSSPSEADGTKARFGVPDRNHSSPTARAKWTVNLEGSSSAVLGKLVVSITIAANAPIGEYSLSAEYKGQSQDIAKFIVLFNPWCAGDSVYMPKDTERKEYVLNEDGIIYRGSKDYISPLNWNFAQFEENMPKICMKMLNLSKFYKTDKVQDVGSRCLATYVSRSMSAMVNCQDDNGVLEGRWDGSYSDGERPSHWNGSYPILSRWYKTGKPVKYGQCWVFAGVMCSVMRLLGIPCRVVTNFVSAHDTDGNLSIDKFHSHGDAPEKHSADSVWNFHVWVEGWMKREDLGEGIYNGWQVVDPTPQEMSEGLYCCGPAPVNAILSGNVQVKYDLPFVFAEVNADVIDWLVMIDGDDVKVTSDTKRVGQNISTKEVGYDKRQDLTNTYKCREGSKKERKVYEYALSHGYTEDEWEEEDEEDEDEEVDASDEEEEEEEEGGATVRRHKLKMGFEEVKKLINGRNIRLRVTLKSDNKDTRSLTLDIKVQGMLYTGHPVSTIQSEVREAVLLPKKELKIPIKIPYSSYHPHMPDCDSILVSVVATDKEFPKEPYLAEDDLVLLDPLLSVTVPDTSKMYFATKAEILFANVTDETLTECSLTVSGSGLLQDELKCSLPDLRCNSRVRVKLTLVPYRAGSKKLLADFDCKQFKNIKGSATTTVQ